MKKIYRSNSEIEGLGLIAGEDIKKGEFIQFIKGKIRHFIPTNKKESISYPVWIGIGKYRWIDPKYPNQYLNHSCNPNAGIKGKVTMIALKDIKKGEEITIDYSTTESDEMWEMKCLCGEKNCRKIIRSIQYLPQTQYIKYMPGIPSYFQNVYKRYNKKKVLNG